MRRGDPTALSAVEAAFSAGRIPDARRLYAEWHRGSRRQRTSAERARAFLLSANLHLIAGKARKAERCIRALERIAGGPIPLQLRAQLSVLEGDFREAKRLIDTAVKPVGHEEDPALRAALIRQRGLMSLTTGETTAGQADLAETARLARLVGDEELFAGAVLDMAESVMALGDYEAARALIEQAGELTGEAALRCRTLFPAAGPEGDKEEWRHAPTKLVEVELLLNEALSAASTGKIPEARSKLDGVKSAGWCEDVESFAGMAGLIEAVALLKSEKPKEGSRTVNRIARGLTPGARRRFKQAILWVRMTAALDFGDRAAALRHGRRLLRELESKRAGIFALEQLRRISGDHSQLYRMLIELELQEGDPVKAFEAIQQFSARSLLRRSGFASLGAVLRCLECNHGSADGRAAGMWALRRVLLREKPVGMKTLGWRKAIDVLDELGSD
jgi:tetratricopeptide (TPR) repeat protein